MRRATAIARARARWGGEARRRRGVATVGEMPTATRARRDAIGGATGARTRASSSTTEARESLGFAAHGLLAETAVFAPMDVPSTGGTRAGGERRAGGGANVVRGR